MSILTRSMVQTLKGAGRAFQTFPVTIASALAYAAVTMIRIQLDAPVQARYQEIISCLQWALAFAAVFGLAAITGVQSRLNKPRAFLAANLLGAMAFVAAFLALYAPPGPPTDLALARAGVAIGVSLLAFIALAAYPPGQSDFARAFFMTQKALVIALIYGLSVAGGASGVAGAVKALIYRELSEKVFMHISTLAGVLAFLLFVGYFPDFRKDSADERREMAQKQPRFIEILLDQILIPILLALTAVLLVWAGRVIVTGTWPPFSQLANITTAYAAGGIWLHVMVTHHETGLARFYRKTYPIATLVILIFAALALADHLRQTGLKAREYSFTLIWLSALAAVVLLLTRKAGAHLPIVALVCGMAILSVLPGVGCQDLPVRAQTLRLEKLLQSQGMLVDDQILPAAPDIDQAAKEGITDATLYLAQTKNARLPAWFDPSLENNATFRSRFGFDQTFAEGEPGMPVPYATTFLTLQDGVIPVADYDWAVSLQNQASAGPDATPLIFEGRKGQYTIRWFLDPADNLPVLQIRRDGQLLMDQTLADYAAALADKYPPYPYDKQLQTATLSDLVWDFSAPGLQVKIVFNSIELTRESGQLHGYFYPAMLFLKEE